jgi:hypothetical protein
MLAIGFSAKTSPSPSDAPTNYQMIKNERLDTYRERTPGGAVCGTLGIAWRSYARDANTLRAAPGPMTTKELARHVIADSDEVAR